MLPILLILYLSVLSDKSASQSLPSSQDSTVSSAGATSSQASASSEQKRKRARLDPSIESVSNIGSYRSSADPDQTAVELYG